jgi:DNA (cytosine-5)-methyltransferase 1
MKPLLLDLFCGAGGAAMGYHRAGYDVVGVDISPQPSYPFEFIQDDALGFIEDIYDGSVQAGGEYGYIAIHASPPCQKHVKGLAAVNAGLGREMQHLDLIAETRALLRETGLPYIIENVEGAPLENSVRLCGSSFGLPIRRHRLFECSFPVMVPECNHSWQNEAKYWTSWRPNGEKRKAKVVQVYGNAGDTSEWSAAMGIDWMKERREFTEAIPPAYTEHIGTYLREAIQVAV